MAITMSVLNSLTTTGPDFSDKIRNVFGENYYLNAYFHLRVLLLTTYSLFTVCIHVNADEGNLSIFHICNFILFSSYVQIIISHKRFSSGLSSVSDYENIAFLGAKSFLRNRQSLR